MLCNKLHRKFVLVPELQHFISVNVYATSIKGTNMFLKCFFFFSLTAFSHFNYLRKSLVIPLGLIVYHGLYIKTRKKNEIYLKKENWK